MGSKNSQSPGEGRARKQRKGWGTQDQSNSQRSGHVQPPTQTLQHSIWFHCNSKPMRGWGCEQESKWFVLYYKKKVLENWWWEVKRAQLGVTSIIQMTNADGLKWKVVRGRKFVFWKWSWMRCGIWGEEGNRGWPPVLARGLTKGKRGINQR